MSWYHGSPLVLDVLAAGSTITQNRDLARVFSHRPAIVSWEDDGRLRHDGQRPGYLYLVLEVDAADLEAHPRSAMPPGSEWLTLRPLPLQLLTTTAPLAEELLSADDLSALQG